MKYIFVLSALLLFFAFELHAQDIPVVSKADSLFSEYLKLKRGNLAPSSSRVPAGQNRVDVHDHSGKCLFGLVNAVRRMRDSLSETNRRLYMEIAQRPRLEKSILSPNGFFRVHYSLSTNDKPAYFTGMTADEQARQVALRLDSVYDFEVTYLGYPSPASDGNIGGDGLFDVYIVDLGGGNYGYTEFDDSNANSVFIVVDNDFNDFQNSHGINGLRVTVAHEFHHAIQLTRYNPYFTDEELFFFESTSTAMEEFVFSDVNDYYYYLPDYFDSPEKPFTQYNSLEVYALVVWQIYLKERFGYDIIKEEWEYFKNNRALTATARSISARGSSLQSELNTFGVWSFYTGYRKQIYAAPDKYFPEGEKYPLLKPSYSYEISGGERSYNLNAKALTNNFLRFNIFNGSYNDTVMAIVTNGDVNNAIENPANDYAFSFTFYTSPAEGARLIANNYYSRLTSGAQDFYTDSYIFNGRTDSVNVSLAELDAPYPAPFLYGTHTTLSIPAAYNESKTAGLYIFSSSMELVYKGTAAIITPNDRFMVRWNALDMNGGRLPGGIYYYVTDSDGKIKKGKLAIINE